ncbi:MAG: hypothetical protein IIC87_07185 [Chloroflexi bacterium]|nr:hypothetical protein [Chloroflexota bacterium]
MDGGELRPRLQRKIAYGVAVAVFAELAYDDFTDDAAEGKELEFGAAEIAGQVESHVADVGDSSSGLAEAPEVTLTIQGTVEKRVRSV